MKRFDLISPAMELRLALENLQNRLEQVTSEWDDCVAAEFRTRHVEPIEPIVRRALEAAERISGVVGQAVRACDEPHRS